MSWTIDDSDIPDGGGLPPEGPHHGCTIADAQLKRSNGGDQMVKVCIAQGDRIIVWDHIMMEGKGLGIGIKKLESIGLALRGGDDKWQIPDVEEWTSVEKFTVQVKHEDWNGKPSAKVDFDTPGFGYGPDPGNATEAEPDASDEDDDIPF